MNERKPPGEWDVLFWFVIIFCGSGLLVGGTVFVIGLIQTAQR